MTDPISIFENKNIFLETKIGRHPHKHLCPYSIKISFGHFFDFCVGTDDVHG